MLRRAQRKLSPLPSWSVLRLRPREGKGVPEVPARGRRHPTAFLSSLHGGPSHCVPGVLHTVRLTRHNLKKPPWAAPQETQAPAMGPRGDPALSVGGTRPRPGLQLLRAWTVPGQGPGQGPCAGTRGGPSLHTDCHLAGAQGRARGRG